MGHADGQILRAQSVSRQKCVCVRACVLLCTTWSPGPRRTFQRNGYKSLYWALRSRFRLFQRKSVSTQDPIFTSQFLFTSFHTIYLWPIWGQVWLECPPTPLEPHSSRQMKTKTKSYCLYLSPDTHTTWIWKDCAKKPRGGKGWVDLANCSVDLGPWSRMEGMITAHRGRGQKCCPAEALGCFVFFLCWQEGRKAGKKTFFFSKQQHIIM